MRKLDVSAVSNTNALPIKSGTLTHIQLAYQEAITAICNNLLGAQISPVIPYVLYGCGNTGSELNYIIGAGAIYYAGEIYLVPTVTFTAPGGQVAVGTIATTFNNTNADPVTFTDGVSRNIHQIRQIVFAAGVSGSAQMDYTTLLQTPLVLVNQQISTLPSSYVVTFDQDKTVFFAAAPIDSAFTFSFTNAVVGNVVRLKWTYAAGRVLTITRSQTSTIVKESGDLTQVSNNTNSIYFIYMGKNDLGRDEVAYTLKQTGV